MKWTIKCILFSIVQCNISLYVARPCRGRLPAAAAGAPVDGDWADQTGRPGPASSGAFEQNSGGDLLAAELHEPESLPLSEPPHRAAGQSQPSHRHRERSNVSGPFHHFLLFFKNFNFFTFAQPDLVNESVNCTVFLIHFFNVRVLWSWVYFTICHL